MEDPGFPRGGSNPRGGANLLFGIIFAKNCMKMKTLYGGRGARSANAIISCSKKISDTLIFFHSDTLIFFFTEIIPNGCDIDEFCRSQPVLSQTSINIIY